MIQSLAELEDADGRSTAAGEALAKQVAKLTTPALDPHLAWRCLENAAGAVSIGDATQPGQPLVFVNSAFEQLSGYAQHEVLGRSCSFLQGDDRDQPGIETMRQAIQMHATVRVTVRNFRKDGSPFWNDIVLTPIRNDAGAVTHFLAISFDTTHRKVAQTELERTSRRWNALLQNNLSLISVIDRHGRIVYQSAGCQRLLGYAPEDMLTKALLDFVHASDKSRVQALLHDMIEKGTTRNEFEFRARDRFGNSRYISATLHNCLDEPDVGGLILNGHDISSRKKVEAKLKHQAERDLLTGLYNRMWAIEHLRQGAEIHKRGGPAVAVLIVDIDEFQALNDSLGHVAGDVLIRDFAHRLQSLNEPGMALARIGGDEFLAILSGDEVEKRAVELSQEMLKLFRSPMQVTDRVLQSTASIGVALLTAGADGDTLLQNADIALYRAKAEGRNCVRWFEGETAVTATSARLNIRSDMLGAFERQEFDLYFQPYVNTADYALSGAEALLRWHKPKQGVIAAGEFILHTEVAGLSAALTDWVVRRAVHDLSTVPLDHRVRVAVNIPARVLRKPELAKLFEQVFRRRDVEPRWLEIEITETDLLQDVESTMDNLLALREMGVRIALDDFGVGYSGLSYLLSFPVHKIKLDRNFTLAIGNGQRGESVVRGIVRLAREAGLEVLAEGVETFKQRDFLVDTGCDFLQGFLFGKPQPMQDMLSAFSLPDLLTQR